MIIKKGDYSIIEDNLKDEPEEIVLPEYKEGDVKNVRTTTDIRGEQIKAKPEAWDKRQKTVTAKKGIDWKSAVTRVLSGSKLSDKAKKLIRDLTYQKPLIDWKFKLKKFFDKCFTGLETVYPKKRLISSGVYMYGKRRTGVETLKTIVAAIDTSSSISHDQGKTFLIEVANLVETFKADKFIIIYCSNSIDKVIELRKKEKPDLTEWPSTGGNHHGFLPPFEWLDKRKIIPSVMIYLTDTGGTMPTKNQFNISKYDKKVFWFICSPTMYNPPTFGEVIFLPIAGLKKTS